MTKHREGCTRAFGRLDPKCPRCRELAQGAKPRKGWTSWRENDARHASDIANHDCKAAGCGPVCTFGDW